MAPLVLKWRHLAVCDLDRIQYKTKILTVYQAHGGIVFGMVTDLGIF